MAKTCKAAARAAHVGYGSYKLRKGSKVLTVGFKQPLALLDTQTRSFLEDGTRCCCVVFLKRVSRASALANALAQRQRVALLII